MPCDTLSQASGRSILDAIGHTPLLRLSAIDRDLPGIELYAKAEWLNPGGSVKDRAAARIISAAVEAGELTHDRPLLDATSGNTGIAYAMIGAALGYRVTLCVPANITPQRRRILAAYGPELVFTDPLEGSDGAIREARRRFAVDPAGVFYADQYNNPNNWRAHYEATAVELWAQTDGLITHFVAGLGTSGTFMGTGRRLRELKPDITLVSVQPDSPLHGLEGLKHMESAIVPGIYDATLASRDLGVSTEDAYAMTRRLAAEQGLLVGISSGANIAGALRYVADTARQRSAAADPWRIVVICPDGGERYLSERFWSDPE